MFLFSRYFVHVNLIGFQVLLIFHYYVVVPSTSCSSWILSSPILHKKESLILSYFPFVILRSLMVTWFVLHNFWNLDLARRHVIKTFCKLIFDDVILAMVVFVPGLALLPQKLHYLTKVCLIGHVLLLCYIESHLYTYYRIYY